jgi:hypothetical protein
MEIMAVVVTCAQTSKTDITAIAEMDFNQTQQIRLNVSILTSVKEIIRVLNSVLILKALTYVDALMITKITLSLAQ